MIGLNESAVEDAAMEWFGALGYNIGHRPHLASGEAAAERAGFGEVVLVEHLREAIRRLNPAIPEGAPTTIRQDRIVRIERGMNP
jgi:type I restriction enzyme, R subunit